MFKTKYLFSYLLVGFCFFMNLSANRGYKDKITGSLIGGALGDACGAPTEFIKSLQEIKRKYPPNGIQSINSLKEKDLSYDKNDKRVVPYTDDTAMTLPLCNVLIEARKKDCDLNTTMAMLARSFVTDMEDEHGWAKEERAPGNACFHGVKKLKKKIQQKQTDDPQWWQVGENSAGGCGSVMRAHPCGLIFTNNLAKAEEYAVAQSKLTHGHPIALAASAAQAVGVALALQGNEPKKIVEAMIETANKYDSETAKRMKDAAQQAWQKKDKFKSIDEAIEDSQDFYHKYEGWAAHDAIAATIYTFILYPNDIKAAIQLGANTPGDSDSIASMAGALVGARTGFQGQLNENDLQIIMNNQVVQLEGLDYSKELANQMSKIN